MMNMDKNSIMEYKLGEKIYPTFPNVIGVELLEIREGYCRAKIRIDERHSNKIGFIHGGALYTLIDAMSGVASMSLGSAEPTLSANIYYLKLVQGLKDVFGGGKSDQKRQKLPPLFHNS